MSNCRALLLWATKLFITYIFVDNVNYNSVWLSGEKDKIYKHLSEKYVLFSSDKDRDRIIKVIPYWKSPWKKIFVFLSRIDCLHIICSWSAYSLWRERSYQSSTCPVWVFLRVQAGLSKCLQAEKKNLHKKSSCQMPVGKEPGLVKQKNISENIRTISWAKYLQ